MVFQHKLSRLFLPTVLWLVCTVGIFAQEGSFIKATDSRLVYVGRTMMRGEAAVWTYPGVQIHAIFEGTSVAMRCKPQCGFFMIQIDGGTPFKVESTEEELIPLAQGLEPGEHRLQIVYAVEGLLFKPEFYGLVLDAGCKLGEPPVLPSRRLEFIGNSITCGYGIEDTVGMKRFSYSTQNNWFTYEAISARELGAQLQVVARSGIGIYRNCNGKRQGDSNTMTALFPYTLFGTSGAKWDFSRYQPDVVCVNLGTNDTTSPGYDTNLLTDAYKRFLRTLRSKYPNAKIVLLTGTMLSGKRLQDVKRAQDNAVAEAKQRGDREVYRFDFTPEDGTLGYGTHKHPSLRRHARMAEELVPFIRKITGWKE